MCNTWQCQSRPVKRATKWQYGKVLWKLGKRILINFEETRCFWREEGKGVNASVLWGHEWGNYWQINLKDEINEMRMLMEAELTCRGSVGLQRERRKEVGDINQEGLSKPLKDMLIWNDYYYESISQQAAHQGLYHCGLDDITENFIHIYILDIYLIPLPRGRHATMPKKRMKNEEKTDRDKWWYHPP